MQLKRKTRFMFFSIMIIVSGFSALVNAQDDVSAQKTEKSQEERPSVFNLTSEERLVGFGFDMGYVGPYYYRGIPQSKGPCLQTTYAIRLWEFTFSAFMNQYGSKKDLVHLSGGKGDKVEVKEGAGSNSLLRADNVKFYLNWIHDFTDRFTLNTGFTLNAYDEFDARTADDPEMNTYNEWFSKNKTYGELNLRPSVKLGVFEIFTEQNVVIISNDYDSLSKSLTSLEGMDTTNIKSPYKSNYHSTYGVKIEKNVNSSFTVATKIVSHIANKRFLNTLVSDPDGNSTGAKGLYQTTVDMSMYYHPFSFIVISGNMATEFVTNDDIGENANIRGATMFGGIHLKFLW